MRRALLDVNVLLALLDSDHVDHRRSQEWLDDEIGSGWASCAITQNGFVRIISQPRYPNSITPAEAVDLLSPACAEKHHEFWPADISLLDGRTIEHTRLYTPRQVTAAYLLALAVARGGRLVTMDRGISLNPVRGATEEHLTVL
jgi:toxin-antitoxin system PIN domain toxin